MQSHIPQIIPESTYVDGVCSNHMSNPQNIVVVDVSNGVLSFHPEITNCMDCNTPSFKRGVLRRTFLRRRSRGPAPCVRDSNNNTRNGPAPCVRDSNNNRRNAVKATQSSQLPSWMQKPEPQTNCEKCNAKLDCRFTNPGCRMCEYFESLHQSNTPHNFASCTLCSSIVRAAARQEEEAEDQQTACQEEDQRAENKDEVSSATLVPALPEKRKKGWFSFY